MSLAVVVALVSYVGWQARHLITGPEVVVIGEQSIVQTERIVTLEGVAKNVTSLQLNGRPIAIDQEGGFAEGVILENGYTVVSIDARDRYGREIHWERPFVYKEKTDLVRR